VSYADDLLAIARDHAKGNKTESNWRTAANRAYYSSFHALLVWEKTLPETGDAGQAKGEHEQLIQRLCHPAKRCSTDQRQLSLWLAGRLDSLRAVRIVADYRPDDGFTLEQAVLACGTAASILERVQS